MPRFPLGWQGDQHHQDHSPARTFLFSYFLTSRFGVPHGMAVASTLPAMLAYNAEVTDEDCVDSRGVAAVRQRIARILELLRADHVDDACAKIAALLSQVGCPTFAEIIGPQ